jgi:plastocyanin
MSFDVNVDGETDEFVGAFSAYFPSALSARPGDTIRFDLVRETGEPHTVTLGAIVDENFEFINEACPQGIFTCEPTPEQEEEYGMLSARLPSLLPEGPGDANQTAAQPCFLTTGEPATDGAACTEEQQQQAAFDGTQTYYNSGWMGADDTFEVELAGDIAPGVYNYFCLLHREAMAGTITVVAPGTPVPDNDEVQQQGEQEFEEMVTTLSILLPQLEAATPDAAIAGLLSEQVFNAQINEFGPKEADIPVGGSMTWTIMGNHTISFNAPQSAKGLRQEAPDGSVHINVESITPANSPDQEPPDPNAPPPDPNAPPQPVVIDAGQWDGQEFLSSGLVFSFPPELVQYKLTFTEAGTYNYLCLIHDGMEGTVNVGG